MIALAEAVHCCGNGDGSRSYEWLVESVEPGRKIPQNALCKVPFAALIWDRMRYGSTLHSLPFPRFVLIIAEHTLLVVASRA